MQCIRDFYFLTGLGASSGMRLLTMKPLEQQ
jgi:hypothetical protein